jgi:rhodanese-related sulfurtransferase
MNPDIRVAVREACGICVVAILIGLAYSAVAGKGLFTVTAHTATPIPSSTFLTYDEAHAIYEGGTALFVDARHAYDYQKGHIRSAINLPLAGLDSSAAPLKDVARDRLIVTYCDGVECNSSVELAKKLYDAGFLHVKIFFGGWNEWTKNNQPTEQ